MKRIIILIFMLYLLTITYVASAHPPTKMNVHFKPASKILAATITHPVQNVRTHFIQKVSVKRRGKKIIEHTLSKQDNNKTQTVSFLIPDAQPGDLFEMEAYCNISGRRTKRIQFE